MGVFHTKAPRSQKGTIMKKEAEGYLFQQYMGYLYVDADPNWIHWSTSRWHIWFDCCKWCRWNQRKNWAAWFWTSALNAVSIIFMFVKGQPSPSFVRVIRQGPRYGNDSILDDGFLQTGTIHCIFLWRSKLSSQRTKVKKPAHLGICGEPICIGNAECVSIFP